MSNDLVNDAVLDVDGFLLDGETWTEALGFELAAVAGIEEMTSQHWAIINKLRDDYKIGDPDLLPQIRNVCTSLAMRDDCVTRLFGDPLVAWRVAGLPKPQIGIAAFTPTSELV